MKENANKNQKSTLLQELMMSALLCIKTVPSYSHEVLFGMFQDRLLFPAIGPLLAIKS